MREIGYCSLCGGLVTLPEYWHSVRPPRPTCQSCGAVERRKLPVIPMTPLDSGTRPAYTYVVARSRRRK